MKISNESFRDWKLESREVSNGVTFFEMTNLSGCQVSCTDHDYERGLNNCFSYAFGIEKQIFINWNKFLYDFCKFEFNGIEFKEELYSEKDFGSWHYSLLKKRIVYDGKNSELSIQKKGIFNNWNEIKVLNKKEITLESIKEFTDFIK